MAKSPIRIGVIGLGRHGARYVEHLRAGIRGARVTVVCRTNERQGARQAKAWGLRFCPDWRAVCTDPEVDAVAVVVPCDLHGAIVPEALAAGKDVILEKPLAHNARAARGLVQAVEAHPDRRVFFAHTLRYAPPIQAMKKRIAGGKFGPVEGWNLDQRLERKPQAWEHDPARAGAGNILQTGVHMFDLVRFLSAREVVEVSCVSRRVSGDEVEDWFGARLLLDDGTWALCEGSKFCRARTGCIEAVAAEGVLSADHVNHRLTRHIGGDSRELPVPGSLYTLGPLLHDAVRCFATREAPAISIDDGWASFAVAHACLRSASGEGRRVAPERP